jgi:hypothetical protein
MVPNLATVSGLTDIDHRYLAVDSRPCMRTSIVQASPSEGDFLSVRKYQDKSCDKVSPLTEVKVALLDSHLWRIPIFALLSQSLSL